MPQAKLSDPSGRGKAEGFKVIFPMMQHPYTEAEIQAVVDVMRNAEGQTQGKYLGQHRTIAEASAVESPIRQETIGFPAHFFARAHNFKPPGRACQPEADSPMRT